MLPKSLHTPLLALAALHFAAQADPIDDVVASEMRRQHSPAIGLAVVRNGAPIKVRGYGIINLEHRARATETSLFQTGSVGKQFTAALVMLLVRDGKIQLDAPVSMYLPEAPASWANITVRHLLTHTSGLRGTDPAVDLWKDYSEAELLASAYKLPLKSKPGDRHDYSNLGYHILGILCSRVGGKFWGDQMRERVFAPLGMNARVISERDVIVGRAAGYERFEGQFENQRWVAPTQNTTADGSLYVSPRDMAGWSIALDGRQFLSAAEKAAMWQPAPLANGQTADYGFGWALSVNSGHRVVRHRGDWQGFTAYILHMPEDRLTVSVLMNRSNAQPHVLADRIAAHFISDLRKPSVRPPDSAALLQQTIYLREKLNDWKPTLRFVMVASGVLEVRSVLSAGMHQFKVGDADWKVADLGAKFDEALAKIGRPQALEFKGEDLFLEVDQPGEYTFQLDLRRSDTSTLTVFGPSSRQN